MKGEMKAVVLKDMTGYTPDAHYTKISNAVLSDKSLSLSAVGLYCVIWSLPESWDFTVSGLALIVRDTLSSVKSYLRELKNAGYIRTEQHRKDGMFSKNDCRIYFLPQTGLPLSGNSPAVKSPTVNPTAGEPPTVGPTAKRPPAVNRPQVINNKVITNKRIKQEEIKRMKIPPGFENGIPDDRIIF